MEHVVFFPSPDGAPAFRRVPTFEEAVRLVEHLRNVEGLTEVSVHPLGAEVPLAFRAWYRVEVPAAEAVVAAEPAPAEAVVVPAVEVAPEPVLAAVPEQTAAESPAPSAAPAEQPVEQPGEAAAEPDLVEAGSPNGHSADGVKSLGFFA